MWKLKKATINDTLWTYSKEEWNTYENHQSQMAQISGEVQYKSASMCVIRKVLLTQGELAKKVVKLNGNFN